MLNRYPYVHVSDNRTVRDYLYYPEDLKYFTGRRYSGQRNHIKKFYKLCPDAEFRALDKDDADAIARFWTDYEAEFPKNANQHALDELSEMAIIEDSVGTIKYVNRAVDDSCIIGAHPHNF